MDQQIAGWREFPLKAEALLNNINTPIWPKVNFQTFQTEKTFLSAISIGVWLHSNISAHLVLSAP